MKLASLTLQGFKSFGNRVTFEFAPGVTAIIGPNGSGKSNVLDALRWTTGGGRAREFRATDKTDLIFHGASGKRSVGLAEVELELRSGSGSVKVYRSLDRDGTTRLRLNGRAARFLDVEEALAGSGLGRSGLAIIGQGEVSQVLMADPGRLLDYVAEAAGVSRLAGRRDQTAARLDTATSHLERLQDVLVELSSRCETLAREAEGARRHADLTATHLRLRYTLAVQREAALTAEVATIEAKRAELEAALAEGRHRLAALRASGQERAARRDAAEERYREAAAQLEYRRGNLRVAEERRDRLTERRSSLQTRLDSLRAEAARLSSTPVPEAPAERLPAASAQVASAHGKADEAAAVLDGATAAEAAARDEHESCRAQQATLERAAAASRSRRMSITAELAQVEEQLEALAAAHESADLPTLEAAAESLANSHATLLAELESRRSELQATHEAHSLASAEAVARRHAAQRSKAAFEARRGFAQGPRNALSAGIAGVIGAVADLVSVPHEYQEAISGALGRRAEYVVVDTAETGRKVLSHVRKAGGFVTVMPLDLLRQQPERGLGAAAGRDGVVALATDLISHAEGHAVLFENLLGGTVVVTDMEAATAIARRPGSRPRLVTLQGDILEPTGAMSGGKRSQQATVLGAAAELEEAEEAARESGAVAATAQRRLDQVQTEVRALLERVAREAEAVRGAEAALARAREERAGREGLREDLRRRHDRLLTEDQALRTDATAPSDDDLKLAETATSSAARRLAEASAALDAAREAAATARLVALEAERAAAVLAERWRAYEDAEQRHAAALLRLGTLEFEIGQAAAAVGAIDVEVDAAAAAVAEARAAVPAGLAEEEGELSAARAALQELERDLTSETSAQASRAEALEEAKLQAARRETALEIAQEELRGFSEGIEPLELQERAARARLKEVTDELELLGAVNHRAAVDLAEVTARREELEAETVQAALAVAELSETLGRIDKETSERLGAALSRLRGTFGRHVQQLFGDGAKGAIEVEEEASRPVGVRIRLQPPGKQTHSLHLLSVGERTMGALAFLFALIADEEAGLPVAVLDEVDAPLDEANIRRYGAFVARLAAEGTQFILITHQKATFEIADTLWGITTEQGVSRSFSIRREEGPALAALATP